MIRRTNLFALILGLSILAVVVAIIVSHEEACESKDGCASDRDDDDSSSALMQLRSIRRELQRQLGFPNQKLASSESTTELGASKRDKKVKAFYEMCKAEGPSRRKTFSILQDRKRADADSGAMTAEQASCDLNLDQVIEEDTPAGVVYSCCPLSQKSCSGCAKHMNGQCITCSPGYFMIAGLCTACVDTTGWTSADGDTCWNATCSDTKVRGISSNEACCRCSGGHHAATPFQYRAEVALLGSDYVAGGPVPRTADRYSLDDECELILKGISIDGETGQLKLVETVDAAAAAAKCGQGKDCYASLGTETFEVSCTITAHQTNLLNYSTTLTVKADWFAYRSFNNYALVLPVKGTSQNVGPSKDPRFILGSSLLEEEEDEAAGESDADVGSVGRHNHTSHEGRPGKKGKTPQSNSKPKPKAKPSPPTTLQPTLPPTQAPPPPPVSLWLENNDYMCYAKPDKRLWCWYEMYCAAEQTGWWLVVDEYGYLTAEAQAPLPGAPGVTGIDTWNEEVGAPGGTCQVTVHHKTGFPWKTQGTGPVRVIKFNFPVARPVAWPEFSYDTPVLISTIGELLPILYANAPTPPEQAAKYKVGAPPQPQYGTLNSTGTKKTSLMQALSGAPVPESYATPSRFSISCDEFPYQTSGMVSFAFDSTTGAGTLNGLPYLTLDVTTGSVHVDAITSLVTVLDGLDTTDIRRHLTLTCAVIAHFDFYVGAQNPSTYTSLTITLQDDTCWLPMTGLFLKPTTTHPDEFVTASSDSACRTACRLSPTCTHYVWDTAASTCEFVHYRCQDTASLSTCREVTAMEKVANCGEEKSCIRLNFAGHWQLSGYYCPKALNAFTGWVYERESVTPEDVLWLVPYDANRDSSTGCSAGQWLLRKPDSRDYLSKTDFIAEFNGEVRLCLDASGDITELALTSGTVNLTVAAAPNPNVTPVPTTGTAAIENPTCGLPNITALNDEVEAEAPTEDDGALYVEPIVLDDPTTDIPDDHWLHPCSCFSESGWGQVNPVDSESFQNVPAGSGNQYHPEPFELVNGEYTCQPGSDSLISITIYGEEETAAEDFEVMCQQSCRGNGDCLFFFEGTAGNTKQCRLYKKCTVLVREVGIVGSLKGLAMREPQLCRVANPDLCSQVSNRRWYLGAPTSATDLNPSPSSGCLYENLLQQCDFKMLLDQLGINSCGKCSYSSQDPAFWQGKTPPPEGRASGYQLEGRCWEERYTAVPLSGTGPSSLSSTTQLLTCASGMWVSPDGSQGLSNFACATCITVGKSPYRNYLSQNREELYFTPRQELYLYVMSSPPMRLATNGTLVDTPLDLVTESSPTRVTPPDYIYGTMTNNYMTENVALDYCVGIEQGRAVDIASSTATVVVTITCPDCTVGTATYNTEVSAYGAWSSTPTYRTFEMVDAANEAYLKSTLTAGTQTASDGTSDFAAIVEGIAMANAVDMPHIAAGGRYAGELMVQLLNVEINGTELFYPTSTDTITIADVAFGYDTFPISTTADIQVDNQNYTNPLWTTLTVHVEIQYTYSVQTADVAAMVDCTTSEALSLGWYDGAPSNPGPALIIESGAYAGKCLSQSTSNYRGSPVIVPATCDVTSSSQMWEYQSGTILNSLRLSSAASSTGCLTLEVERPGDAILRTEACQSTGTGSLTRGNWNYDYSQEEFIMSSQDCFATITPVSACPVTCGGGYQTRTITVLSEARGVGQACPLAIVECGMDPCPNGNDGGWLAEDFVDAGIGVKQFRSTSFTSDCLQFNASGASQFSSATCNSSETSQQIDSAQVPAMLWDLVRKQAANGQLITETTLSAKFAIPAQPRYLSDITLNADCGEDAVVQELRWGTTADEPGLQVRCSAAVINSNYREAYTDTFPRGDFIRAKEGGYCATVSTSDLPGSGATTAEKNLAARGQLAWLQLLKCDPDNTDQMFYWVGYKIKSQSTGLCFWANSTTGYFQLRQCSENIVWDYDKRGTLSASPATAASGWSKVCVGWMKSQKGTEVATKVGVNAECLSTSSDPVNIKSGQMDPSQQQWEVGPGIVGLKDGYVDCPSGFALNTFKVTATEMQYNCAPLGAVGACMEKVTPEVDTVSYDLVQMPRLDLNCTRGAITKISPELASGGDSFKYRYTCSDLTEPAAIVLTGTSVTSGIPSYSGVYCSPENRDSSGRLVYDQRSWYNADVTPSNKSFYFDADQGAWCLENSTCASSDIAVPTDDEIETTEWQAMPVLNFAYSPNPRGVTQPMPKKREFPELIEFKSATPDYARECQNDVTPGQSGFDRDLMNKVFVELPKQNPCSLIGGVSKQDSSNGQATGFSYRVSKNPYELNGNTEYGLTYSDAFDCSTRAINRAGTVFHTDLGFEAATMGREAIEQTQNIVCPVIPEVGLWAGFMAGTETQWKTSKICSSAFSWAFFAWKNIQNAAHMILRDIAEDNERNDCDPLQSGMARIFCDLHCIRDAVREGDAAILSSMETAAKVQTENNRLLMEYYSGLVLDKLDVMSGTAAGLLQEEVRTDVEDARKLSDVLFQEMHSLVASARLDASGSASLSRELDRFLAEEERGLADRLSANKTLDITSAGQLKEGLKGELALLTEKAERLHTVVSGAASQKLSHKVEVDRRVHDFVIQHQELLSKYNAKLGEFQARSEYTSRLQQTLVQAAQPTLADLAMQTETHSVEELMLNLDSTWWELRGTFDAAIEAVEDHMNSMQHTTGLLKDYTSLCTLEYPELLDSFHSTMDVADTSKAKLRDTWHQAVMQLGLLTSKIVDGNAFVHFARADMLAVNIDEVLSGKNVNATLPMTEKGLSLLGRASLCAKEVSQEALEAASLALHNAAYGSAGRGLWMQTMEQVAIVLAEMRGMRHWHGPLGLGPAPHVKQADLSAERLRQSVEASVKVRDALIQDAVTGFQKRQCL